MAGDQYKSFDDVLRDRTLDFVTDDLSPSGVQRAIEVRLKQMTGDTAVETNEQYRKLVAARQFLERTDADATPAAVTGTDLVTIPAQTLERLMTALSVADSTRAAAGPASRQAVERALVEHQGAAATKASADFTKARTLPFAGLGGTAGALWASREALGADLSSMGTTAWALGSSGLIAASLVILHLSRHEQKQQTAVMTRMYDPDVQGDALRLMRNDVLERHEAKLRQEEGGASVRQIVTTSFTRPEYRDALWREAQMDAPNPTTNHPTNFHQDMRSRRRTVLGTVDLDAAQRDAAQLALERFVTMEVLKPVLRHGAIEAFTFV